MNTIYGELTGTHQSSSLNKVQSTCLFEEISSTSAATLKERISMPKLAQLLNGRGPVSGVQRAARLLRKRKALDISQGDTIEVVVPVVKKAKVVSKAGKAVIVKRSKAVIARGGVLKRPVRSIRKTAKVRLSNSR